MLQAKVGELKNSMKTILLQNQQLKQDLKQNRLRKVIQPFASFGVIGVHCVQCPYWNGRVNP